MALKLSPELLIAKYFKGATGGRQLPPKLRRILTIIIIPIWLSGFAWICWRTYDGITTESYSSYQEKELEYQYRGNLTYSNYQQEADYNQSYLTHSRINNFILPLPLYLLVCFILPWIVIRLIFWVKDADKSKLNS